MEMVQKCTCRLDECVAPICFSHKHTHIHTPGNSSLTRFVFDACSHAERYSAGKSRCNEEGGMGWGGAGVEGLSSSVSP